MLDTASLLLQGHSHIIISGSHNHHCIIWQRFHQRQQCLFCPHIIQNHQQRPLVAGRRTLLATAQQRSDSRRGKGSVLQKGCWHAGIIGTLRHLLEHRNHIVGSPALGADVKPEQAAWVMFWPIISGIERSQDSLANARLSPHSRRSAHRDDGNALFLLKIFMEESQLFLAANRTPDKERGWTWVWMPLQRQFTDAIEVDHCGMIPHCAANYSVDSVVCFSITLFWLCLPL